jgi:DivIVA domain-containing protein
VSLTPDDIEGREFPVAADGYDRAEVDGFLVEVSAALRSARARLRAAEAADADAFTALGDEIADVLRAAEQAGARKRAELDAELVARRAEADLALDQARRDAQQEHDQAKRLLTRAQHKADAIIAEAEEQARTRVRQARDEAAERARVALDRARQREQRLVEAERAATDRLRHLRAELDAVLDALDGTTDGAAPVLDLTSGEAVLRPSEQDPATGGPGILGVVRDPFDELVRAAVARAQDHPVHVDDDGRPAHNAGTR